MKKFTITHTHASKEKEIEHTKMADSKKEIKKYEITNSERDK